MRKYTLDEQIAEVKKAISVASVELLDEERLEAVLETLEAAKVAAMDDDTCI